MDSFGKLMFAAYLKRAAALGEWYEEHRYCGTIHVERLAVDGFTVVAHCSCGASYEGTVVVTIAERRIKPGSSGTANR